MSARASTPPALLVPVASMPSLRPMAPSGIEALIAQRQLRAAFQPIVDFDDGAILGYEGLIRGPAGSPLEAPAALFAQANAAGCTTALERAAGAACIEAFARLGCAGKLFLNFSADALCEITASGRDALALFDGIAPHRVVIELTEQSAIDDVRDFAHVIAALRAAGAQFALDDYGNANASMSLWVQLQPDVVKIDRFFIHDIASDALKFEAVRAMQHFAQASGARLVAEGIENEADLIVLRDMGIACGQGFFFGRPAEQATRTLGERAREALRAHHIAVFPEATRNAGAGAASGAPARKMMVHAPALPRRAAQPTTTCSNCSTACPSCTQWPWSKAKRPLRSSTGARSWTATRCPITARCSARSPACNSPTRRRC